LLRVYWYALALPPVVVPASPSAVGPPHALTAARASRSHGAYPPIEPCTALIAVSMLPGILLSEPCLTFQPGAVPFPFAPGVPDSRNAFVVSRGFMTSASGIQFRPCWKMPTSSLPVMCAASPIVDSWIAHARHAAITSATRRGRALR
jgi:hypothetical protein